MTAPREFHVWRGGLSGRIVAGWVRNGVCVGKKWDVTEDVLRIVAEIEAERAER